MRDQRPTYIEMHDGKPFTVECHGDYYDFDFCRRDGLIYYHLSGFGPFKTHREAPQFAFPEESIKTVRIWARKDVALLDEQGQPADPVKRGYRVLKSHPGNPFRRRDIAEGSTVWCRRCEDRLPDDRDNPCEHVFWCERCCVYGGAADYGCKHRRARAVLLALLLCLSAPTWAASTPRDRGKDLRGPVKTQPVKPPPRQGRGWCAEVQRG